MQGFYVTFPYNHLLIKVYYITNNVVVENMWLNESLYTLGYFLKDMNSDSEYSEDEMEDNE